jgi:hypothetical protein
MRGLECIASFLSNRLLSTSGDSTGGIAPCAAVNRLFCGPSPGVTGLDGRANGRGDVGIQATMMTTALKAEGALVGWEFL